MSAQLCQNFYCQMGHCGMCFPDDDDEILIQLLAYLGGGHC